MKRYVNVLYISLGLGFVVAAIVLFIGFQHNPQGTFVDMSTGKADIPYALGIFISWFLLSSIVTAIIGSVITFVTGIIIKAVKGD